MSKPKKDILSEENKDNQIEESSHNLNNITEEYKKTAEDIEDIQKIMKKVVNKNQRLQHEYEEQLKNIESDFSFDLHTKGKSISDVTEIGGVIAKNLTENIQNVISSERELSRDELNKISAQLPNFKKVIDSIDSSNEVEIARAENLFKLLKDSINDRKKVDLSLPKVLGKEIQSRTSEGIQQGFGNIESSFVSAVSEDPVTAKMATGIFWLIKNSTTFGLNIYKKQKKNREAIAEHLRETQGALVDSQMNLAKNLHDADVEHFKLIESAIKDKNNDSEPVKNDTKKESPSADLERQTTRNETPSADLEKQVLPKEEPPSADLEKQVALNENGEPSGDHLSEISRNVSDINKRMELASMNDAEESLEKVNRDNELLKSIDELTDATKTQKDKNKKGLLGGVWNFIKSIPELLSGGISGAIIAMKTKIKESKIFKIFSGLGNWMKGFKIGEKMSKLGGMILKPIKAISKLGKFLLPIGKLVGKFAKMIPGVGQIITVIEGVFGFINAKDILGKDTVTIMDRFAAGIGGIFEGLGEIADMLLGWFGVDTDIKGWLNDNFTKPLAELFNMDLSEIWNNMKTYYGDLWTNFSTGIKEFFSSIFSWENIKEVIIAAWNWSPVMIISRLADGVKSYFVEKFSWESAIKEIENFSKWSPMHLIADFGNKTRKWFKNKFSFLGFGKDKDDDIVEDVVLTRTKKQPIKQPEKPEFIPKRTELSNIEHIKKMLRENELNNNKPEILSSERLIRNTDRPMEIDNLKTQKDIDSMADLGKAINITNISNGGGSSEPSQTPSVMSTIQSSPRDNDIHIQHMNQVFAP